MHRALVTTLSLATVLAVWVAASHAAETRVAVAADFAAAARAIAASFQEKTGHTSVLSFGATGQLYGQMTQDAAFDVFLAADTAHPKRAQDDGLAVGWRCSKDR